MIDIETFLSMTQEQLERLKMPLGGLPDTTEAAVLIRHTKYPQYKLILLEKNKGYVCQSSI